MMMMIRPYPMIEMMTNSALRVTTSMNKDAMGEKAMNPAPHLNASTLMMYYWVKDDQTMLRAADD